MGWGDKGGGGGGALDYRPRWRHSTVYSDCQDQILESFYSLIPGEGVYSKQSSYSTFLAAPKKSKCIGCVTQAHSFPSDLFINPCSIIYPSMQYIV